MFNVGKRVAGTKLRGNWRLETTNAGNVSLKNLTSRNLAAGAKRVVKTLNERRRLKGANRKLLK